MIESYFNSKEYILENGLKLITIKKETSLASLHIGVKTGSINERKDEKGIAHFIEHMLFKGTTSKSNELLNEELESSAGEYNAYTDYNCTVYSITVLKEELEKSIELFSDMLINSNFPEEEMRKEKGVILAEIRSGKDDIEELSFNNINKVAFKESPLKYDIIGKESTVKSFTRSQVQNYFHRYYVPNNSYITVVSNYEHNEVYRYIEKYFSSWVYKSFGMEKVVSENNIPLRKITYKKHIEQSTIIYLYTFHQLTREEELALRILNHRLGESPNSILFRELREKTGLAYDVYSQLNLTHGIKTLYIYTAVNVENIEETEHLINVSISNIKKENCIIDDNTLKLMKKVIRTAVAGTIEDTTDLGNYVLHQFIDNEDIYEFVRDMDSLDKLSKDDLYNTAKKVFNNPTIHILMPEMDEYNE